MPRNDAAATGHDCPGILTQAIDIVQPPGICMSPIADMGVAPNNRYRCACGEEQR
ncbi:MAG TPA: hypothetical protein VKR82_07855 [Candidatus Acidoferrales bacterium]|nr:hypothetical protein [Candidatus Acidoferrales bacterium]